MIKNWRWMLSKSILRCSIRASGVYSENEKRKTWLYDGDSATVPWWQYGSTMANHDNPILTVRRTVTIVLSPSYWHIVSIVLSPSYCRTVEIVNKSLWIYFCIVCHLTPILLLLKVIYTYYSWKWCSLLFRWVFGNAGRVWVQATRKKQFACARKCDCPVACQGSSMDII
jgi:hypothetical protein